MYLHFQNWSSIPSMPGHLQKLELPHQSEVVKVYASPEDPRTVLGRSALHVVDVKDASFDESETYGYENRRAYSGPELEEDLATYGLSDLGRGIARSLFRYSHEQGFCQAAMAAKKRRNWAIRHPFQCIDGIDSVKQPKDERALHLDIFLPASLEKLLETVDYNDADAVLSWRDGAQWFRETTSSVAPSNK